jgi:hypothetical protein
MLKKRNTYINLVLLLLLLTISDNLVLLFFGIHAEGRVIQYVNTYTGSSKYPKISYPVIQFETEEKVIKFNGNWDADYELREIIPIVYKPWRPKKARVKTFWGITKKPGIQFLIALVIWSMIYSSFKPKF